MKDISAYQVTESTTIDADGIKVPVDKTRWITAAELMSQREPETDWDHVASIVSRWGFVRHDATQVMVTARLHGASDIEHATNDLHECKPQIFALLAAEDEIITTRAEHDVEVAEAHARHTSFADAWERGELR